MVVTLPIFTGYFVIGSLVAFVVATIYAKLAKSVRPNYRQQVIYIALTLSILGAWVYNAQSASQTHKNLNSKATFSQSQMVSNGDGPKLVLASDNTSPSLRQSFESKLTLATTSEEQQQLHDILQEVFSEHHKVTLAYRQRFWAILDKAHGTPEEVQNYVHFMQDIIEGEGNYQEILYEDALISYKMKKPFKSEKRAKTEIFLLTQALPTSLDEKRSTIAFRKKNIMRSNDMIAKIASHKSVYFPDTKANRFFDEATLKTIIQNFKDRRVQLELLLKHP